MSWNPSPDPSVVGYEFCYGSTSGIYTSTNDVGTNLNFTSTSLIPGMTYYCAVASYDSNYVLSAFSNEAIETVPLSPMGLTNPGSFTAAMGAYNGLFYQTNADGTSAIDVQTAGFLGNLVIAMDGTYSGEIYVGGLCYLLTGVLDSSGNDEEVVSRGANGLSTLDVTLYLDTTLQTPQLTGVVSSLDTNEFWSSSLMAKLAVDTTRAPAEFPLALLPLELNSSTTFGFVRTRSEGNGNVSLIGLLADETGISQNVAVSREGDIPVYMSLYGGLGLLEGWVNWTGPTPVGTLTWARPAGIDTAIPYLGGFTNTVIVRY